ncbi:MAG: DUF6081 family protein [Candidatus Dormibacteraeota bacterium]|nr:DUF6081 family protein [Candidatus Dormibacteraeota bacterium]
MAQATATPATSESKARTETITYGNFRSIITGIDPTWQIGGFSLPDGTEWKYREPNATVIVENEKLRVRANPLSRSHDRIQVLDNAKHMYFSTARFTPPDDGTISVELSIAGRRHNGVPGDLYDGMATVNLLDFDTGAAIDFFATNDKLATVYGRVLFPGVAAEPPADLNRPTYFCIFNELPVPTKPGQTHLYKITYDKANDQLWWFIDGEEVDHHREVPFKMNSFLVALGMMTEKPIDDDRSISLHGQGLTGEWSPLTITIEHR